MLTFRRILKYTPAVVMGLLVAVWAFSFFMQTIIGLGAGIGYVSLGASQFVIVIDPESGPWLRRLTFRPLSPDANWLDLTLGTGLGVSFNPEFSTEYYVYVPIVVLLTIILPLALGPFFAYRFRLWHYLAYTALVALELAYYLRWQE